MDDQTETIEDSENNVPNNEVEDSIMEDRTGQPPVVVSQDQDSE